MTIEEFLEVCDGKQDLLIKCEVIESKFMRSRAELVGEFFMKRNIKTIYAKHNGNDIEIVIEVD